MFEVRNYNGVEECNGVSSSSLVSCEVLGEESLSDSVEGEVSSEELSSGSVVGEKSKRNIVGEESEKVVEDSAVCRSSETTPECAAKLMESLELPREKVQQTQKVQQYDKKNKEPKLCVGSRVMVHMQGEVQGKALTPNNAEVSLIDQPKDQSIFVSLNRIFVFAMMKWKTPLGLVLKRKGNNPSVRNNLQCQLSL